VKDCESDMILKDRKLYKLDRSVNKQGFNLLKKLSATAWGPLETGGPGPVGPLDKTALSVKAFLFCEDETSLFFYMT
jgi:hypothetical protein